MDDSDGILEGIKDVAGSVASAIGGELKKVGQTAAGQVTGQRPAPSDDEIKKLAKKDDVFSKKSEVEVRARINAIYQEHAARKKRQEMTAQTQEKKQEEQKKEFELQTKKQKETNRAVEASKAEVKNYGAE